MNTYEVSVYSGENLKIKASYFIIDTDGATFTQIVKDKNHKHNVYRTVAFVASPAVIQLIDENVGPSPEVGKE